MREREPERGGGGGGFLSVGENAVIGFRVQLRGLRVYGVTCFAAGVASCLHSRGAIVERLSRTVR